MFTKRSLISFVMAVVLSFGLVLQVPARVTHAEATVAEPFRTYYDQHQGSQVLGKPLTELGSIAGYPAQYFEKGRLEDHRRDGSPGEWAFMYGRLTAELIERSQAPILTTTTTYTELKRLATPTERVPGPTDFRGGTQPVPDGMFVPFDAQLKPAPGHVVAPYFWAYITQQDLFPDGWLHDIGLPLSETFTTVRVTQGGEHTIFMQAFERTILIYDPRNPAGAQVERGNLGTEALSSGGIALAPALQPIAAPTAKAAAPKPTVKPAAPKPTAKPAAPKPTAKPAAPKPAAKRIEVSLSKQWLYAYEGTKLVYKAPVSTGRKGFETPTGQFTIYAKVPLKTMRGSLRGETWVVPNVPNVMYIYGGVALHGTYWHNRFGTGARLSHGCINLPLGAAARLYRWAPVGTPVRVVR